MRWILLLVFAALIAILLWPDDETNRAVRVSRIPEPTQRAIAQAGEPKSIEDAPARATSRTRITRPGPGLDVTVVDEDDRPRRGVPVLLRLHAPDGPKFIAEAITDKRGFVHFEDQNTPALTVCLDPGGNFEPVVAGRWEPDEGFRSLRLTLWEPRELVLRIFRDGEPGLPDGLVLRHPVLSGAQRDPVNGIVRGQFIAQPVSDNRLTISVSAPMYMAAATSVRLNSRSRSCDARLDLRSAVDLVVRVLGRPEIAARIGLVRMLKPRFQVMVAGPKAGGFEESETETSRFLRVTAGRYGVVLGGRHPRRPIHEFDVPAAARSHEVTVDLRGARWIDFKLVLPRDYVAPGVPLVEVDDPVGGTQTFRPTDRFLLLAHREASFTLRAPLLRPHPERGTVATSQGGTVTLEAIRAPLLTFAWNGAGPTEEPASGMWLTFDGRAVHLNAFRVTLTPVSDRSAKKTVLTAWPDGARYRCGPLPVGTFDIWLRHPHAGAPVLVRNVRLGEIDVDLGRITPLPGSMLEVDVLNLKQGELGIVRASGADAAPTWTARGVWAGESRAVLGPLPAGPTQVEVRVGTRTWTRTVECDGRTARTIEVDCGAD